MQNSKEKGQTLEREYDFDFKYSPRCTSYCPTVVNTFFTFNANYWRFTGDVKKCMFPNSLG